MKRLRAVFLLALVPACFFAGIYGGPIIRHAYAAMFPAPEFRQGDYREIYARAGASVVLFTTSTCPYCKQARKLLDDEGVVYKDYVVDKSSDAAKLFHQHGGDGVPMIYVADREIRGFREKAIREALMTLNQHRE